MKKLYLDQTELKACMGVFIRDAEVMNAGTTVNAMSVKAKNPEYERYASEYGIHFIFADALPQVDFYAVPQADIFATDGENGLFATVAGETDSRGDHPIVYIRGNEVSLVAAGFREFILHAADWKQNLRPYEDITF